MIQYYIYTLTDPIDGIVKYIGKTKNLKDRLLRHLGNSYLNANPRTSKNKWIKWLKNKNLKPIMEILDECDINNVDDLEKYWIGQFKTWGFKLKNMTDGGDGGGGLKGRKLTTDVILKMKMNHPFRKGVIQFDKNMNVISSYDSIREASTKTGFSKSHISRCCRKLKSYNTVGGFIWSFDSNNVYSKPIKKEKTLSDHNKRICKMVIEYDLDGNILNEYSSMSEASRKSGCHIYLISNCCKKKQYYTVNNKTFRYKGDVFDYVPYNKHIQINSKQVEQYDTNELFLKTYDSTKQAAKENSVMSGNIARCCKLKKRKNGDNLIVGGFIWRYKNDTV